jgi:hypothetical protein
VKTLFIIVVFVGVVVEFWACEVELRALTIPGIADDGILDGETLVETG